MRKMTPTDLSNALAELFAPWVQALGLQVEAADEAGVRLRLPQNPALTRVGDMLCGQAMLAAADTAMVLALMQHFGEFRPCSTVQLNSSFLKPLSQQDALIQASVLRVGKSLAFGEIEIRGARDDKLVCKTSTTYALL
jgi:uncharacterized protein (TIGR00369 family)